MSLVLEFVMWLTLLAAIILGVCILLVEFVIHDTTEHDMEFLWNHRYSYSDLHLERKDR